jgi:dTDP-glucose 4,6-dehydratase
MFDSRDMVLVTGAAGFIGSGVVRYLIEQKSVNVLAVDALTYAGHRANLEPVARSDRH